MREVEEGRGEGGEGEGRRGRGGCREGIRGEGMGERKGEVG